jgi:hypothetical protein
MTRLKVRRGLIDHLVGDVIVHGERTEEAGAFLLASEETPELLDTIAIPGRSGVTRKRDLFAIASEAILELFEKAAREDLAIRAQVHSHRREAFLSPTDLEYGFSVEGFVTCVVPWYGNPSEDPRRWGWWIFGSDAWNECGPPLIVAGDWRRIDFAVEASDGH